MEEIFIILFLILLNGIFSMSEISLISARKSSLQSEANKGNKSAQTALKLAENPDRFLSSVQVGITLIGLLTGMFSGNKIPAIFTDVMVRAGLSESVASALAQTIIIIVVTYFSIVLGELVPKRIGMSAAEKVAKIVAGPMKFISKLTYPLVWVLSKSTSLIVKILGVKSQESKVTEEEIKSIIQEGTEEGEVSLVEQDIVERVFTLGDLSVSTIMTLRNDVTWLEIGMNEAEVRETIENNLYEEYPVADGDLDHVVGILRLKDFVLNVGKGDFHLEKMIQTPVYFHENMNVYKVLEEMKSKKVSRALVCDEFGSCCGIITLKDILEALIGTVSDDDDSDPDIVERSGKDGWLVDGQCSIYDFLRHFDQDDEMQDYEYTTVAGLIFDELEHMPVAGDTVEWGDFTFEVVDMDGPRIDKIIVKLKEKEDEEEDDD